MATDDPTGRAELFWQLAETLYTDPAVTRSTMMGFPCLRCGGEFFASLERGTNHLVVKLPAERVGHLVATGQGLPFAPAGRVFKQWVALPVADPDEWNALLGEAKEFAGG